ncbi:MAG: hypothetical protein WB579_10020 [Bryobacteraceae bacterium]
MGTKEGRSSEGTTRQKDRPEKGRCQKGGGEGSAKEDGEEGRAIEESGDQEGCCEEACGCTDRGANCRWVGRLEQRPSS